MKKILFVSFVLCFSVFCCAEVSLTSGSLNCLKNSGEYAYVEIDWSKAKVVEFDRDGKVEKNKGSIDAYNKSQGSDWVKDWPEVKRFVVNCTAWEKYPGRACFNRKNKKGVLITVNPQVWKAYLNSKDEDEKEDMQDHCIWVNPSKAKYKFVLTVDQIDMGSGIRVWGVSMKFSTRKISLRLTAIWASVMCAIRRRARQLRKILNRLFLPIVKERLCLLTMET